ncbi:alpha-amylase family protein [Paenibacillus elgii]|uniref:alpha-amylase family protein n=1 Tax=Paenibacillus elgii TaxID=189691 RepID=UPI0013D7E69D|nr:alpha-amylase family protein [Paenibacillus elgii]
MDNVIVLYDPEFPFLGERMNEAGLERLSGVFRVVSAEQLPQALAGMTTGCLVNLHAPYFPKEAWGEILDFLQRGGGLLSMGGAPFRIPVYRENGAWCAEAEQTAYHRQLRIHEAMTVDPAPVAKLAASEDVPLLRGQEPLFEIQPTCSLILHVTRHDDQPHESGSAGPMDAHLYPLLKGISSEGREVSAPVVLLENTKGEFAGGRWLFVHQLATASFWENGGVAALAEWAAYCALGVTELTLKTNYATYEPGERPKLKLQMQGLQRTDETATAGRSWRFAIEVRRESRAAEAASGPGEPAWSGEIQAAVFCDQSFAELLLPLSVEPGLYDIVCRAESDLGEVRVLRQGFWGRDEELLRTGSPLRSDRDYFWKDGRPLPVVGMTYMSSDVARKFLFLPNVSVWNRDMAQMRRAGINFIRTGIWTAHRQVMFVDGHLSEEALRAIDAFILTAKRYGLEVNFTFFAFAPEAWEGANPYLDPRSVEAQKRFLAGIVSRHRHTTNVHWDLINEPSLFDPKRVFAGPRPVRDRKERAAFSAWLQRRHGSVRRLQERWGMTPTELPSFEAASPPAPEDINFDVHDMARGKRGAPWLDYTLFTMEMHNEWVRSLSGTIRGLHPGALITVGQDEALGGQRPSPLFYGSEVDYTSVHSWWLNDDLVWDGIFTKTVTKPNLVQETGIMYLETPDGRAKRSETELKYLLERKYAYAFATGATGAVQWIWNTNYYMNNINESNIGALRADGTEKPEADVSYDFGRFMNEIRDLFTGRKPEEIAVVFPYSNDFSNRRLACEATSRLTRVLAYELKCPFFAVGEYDLKPLSERCPKLIVVPSAHNFSDRAMETLVEHIRTRGGTLLFTGPLGLDEYWRPTGRLDEQLGPYREGNVCREERLMIDGNAHSVSFGRRKIAELCKGIPEEDAASGGTRLTDVFLGMGRLFWCPLPVELNDRTEPIRELYKHVIQAAGVRPEMVWRQSGELAGIYGRKLSFAKGALFVFVSEYAHPADVEIEDPANGAKYRFTIEAERSVLFAADVTGKLIAVYRDNEVRIEHRNEQPAWL